VSVPKPNEVILTSLAAQLRRRGRPTGRIGVGSDRVSPHDGRDCALRGHLQLEYELERLVDGFGPNSLIMGPVQAGRADAGVDAGVVLERAPLLVYLSAGRLSEESASRSCTFPADV
jgi:hypothetical protein